MVVSSGTASGPTVASGGTVEIFNGGTLAGNVANDGTVNYDIIGSTTFSGTLTGAGTLVVSAEAISTWCRPIRARRGRRRFDAGVHQHLCGSRVLQRRVYRLRRHAEVRCRLDRPITVVNSNDTVIAQPGSNNWINAAASYTLPANIDALSSTPVRKAPATATPRATPSTRSMPGTPRL